MRYLAIDFGLQRIGLAVSDETGGLAWPYATRQRQGNKRDVADLIATVRGLSIEGLVIGLPRSASGAQGDLEARVRAFAGVLQDGLKAAGLTIELFWQDERFSTAEALKQMRVAGISQRQGRESSGSDSVDARAAAVILQGFLDARRASPHDPALASTIHTED